MFSHNLAQNYANVIITLCLCVCESQLSSALTALFRTQLITQIVAVSLEQTSIEGGVGRHRPQHTSKYSTIHITVLAPKLNLVVIYLVSLYERVIYLKLFRTF